MYNRANKVDVMDNELIERKRTKIASKKATLEKKELLLKALEGKLKTKKLIRLGNLVSKAGLENIDQSALFGALLEICDKMKDTNTYETWKQRGSEVLAIDKDINPQRLIITFVTEISPDIKKVLRDNRFRWNAFRREWHALGKKEAIETLLNAHNLEYHVEIVTD